MTSKKYKIIIAILLLVVVLLSIRVIFDSKFDDFDRFIKARQNYEGATEQFDENFQGLIDWIDDYKESHPDASEEEINQAFKEAWEK